MDIHFSHDRYEELRKTYRKWWSGELDRPIVPIITLGHSTDFPAHTGPQFNFANAWNWDIDPREFIDSCHAQLSSYRWHGDAFPHIYTAAFGPGVLAAFLGCTPVSTTRTVWFKSPDEDLPIEELHFEFDDQNRYYRRVENLFEAAMEKWHGSVVVEMTDLGGILDVLASFRGTENLLIDLLEEPDEVLRCVGELQELWFRYYDKLNAVLSPEAQGYSHWYGMYCETPGYILQSDFSYMISPDMFRTFAAPELASSASRIDNAVYHMDGIGEIPHLNHLLAIDSLKGIEWTPGAGEPDTRNWDELHLRILASGKKLILYHRQDDRIGSEVARHLGQIYLPGRNFKANDMEAAKHYGERFGVEVSETEI